MQCRRSATRTTHRRARPSVCRPGSGSVDQRARRGSGRATCERRCRRQAAQRRAHDNPQRQHGLAQIRLRPSPPLVRQVARQASPKQTSAPPSYKGGALSFLIYSRPARVHFPSLFSAGCFVASTFVSGQFSCPCHIGVPAKKASAIKMPKGFLLFAAPGFAVCLSWLIFMACSFLVCPG